MFVFFSLEITTCSDCVTGGLSWQIGKCYPKCQIADTGCYNTNALCMEWENQQNAVLICDGINDDPNKSCSSCLSASIYCVFDSKSKQCLMGADYGGNKEKIVMNIDHCPNESTHLYFNTFWSENILFLLEFDSL